MDELCPPILATKCAAKLKQRAGCLQVWERRYKILGIVNTTSMSTCIKNLYSVCHSELQLHANVLERVIVFLPAEHRRQILHPHCSSIVYTTVKIIETYYRILILIQQKFRDIMSWMPWKHLAPQIHADDKSMAPCFNQDSTFIQTKHVDHQPHETLLYPESKLISAVWNTCDRLHPLMAVSYGNK